MKKLLIVTLFAIFSICGVKAHEASCHADESRYVIFTLTDSEPLVKFKLDTMTGEVVEYFFNVGEASKTKVLYYKGIDRVNPMQSRNGRFQLVKLPAIDNSNEFVVMDSDTGRVWQSKRKKQTLQELK